MRPIRALAASAVLAGGVLVAGAPALDAAPPSDDPTTAAEYGARWLAATLGDGGFVEGPGGAPATGATVNVAVALASTGVEPGRLDDAVEWMRDEVEAVVTTGGVDDPGRIGQLLVVLDATGDDPRAFGGVDLVARLEATLGDFAPGLYGASDPTYDGAYRQGLALMGLAAAGAPTPSAALDWLDDQQCTGAPSSAAGGWVPYRSDLTQPCPEPDPASFVGPDTNQTAVAVQGLAAWGRSADADPMPFLRSAQVPDGGFAYYPGQGVDANSTALVIQGLLAAGEDLDDWAVAGGDPLSSLVSWQLGCDVPADEVGAFASPYSEGAPDALATQQAVPAVAQRTFPLGDLTPVETPVPCTAPSTTTTSGGPSTSATSSTLGTTSTTLTPPRPAVAATAVAGTPAFTG